MLGTVCSGRPHMCCGVPRTRRPRRVLVALCGDSWQAFWQERMGGCYEEQESIEGHDGGLRGCPRNGLCLRTGLATVARSQPRRLRQRVRCAADLADRVETGLEDGGGHGLRNARPGGRQAVCLHTTGRGGSRPVPERGGRNGTL